MMASGDKGQAPQERVIVPAENRRARFGFQIYSREIQKYIETVTGEASSIDCRLFQAETAAEPEMAISPRDYEI
jgi:hypothetical protein